MKFRISALSINELGQRKNQEDSIYPPLTGSLTKGNLFILCDGMGGHASGEVASATVCEVMSEYVKKKFKDDDFFYESDFYEALDAAYDQLDAKDSVEERKMGTTLTFVKFHKGGCFIAHIGDSRIYHIRPSAHKVMHVTRDHSLINALIDAGELTPEEAKASKQKNVITRAMQPHQDNRVKAECTNLTDIEAGDYLYMCSDGMLEEMEDSELVNILSLKQPDMRKIEILKGATKDNKDNHSAHLIRIVSMVNDEVRMPVAVAAPNPEPQPEDSAHENVTSEHSKRHPLYLSLLIGCCVGIALFFMFKSRSKAESSVPVEQSDTEIIESVLEEKTEQRKVNDIKSSDPRGSNEKPESQPSVTSASRHSNDTGTTVSATPATPATPATQNSGNAMSPEPDSTAKTTSAKEQFTQKDTTKGNGKNDNDKGPEDSESGESK